MARDTAATTLRVEVHVRPGARRPGVGGTHDGRLVVAVGERAVDGRANAAVCRAVAVALGVAPSTVELTAGHRARRKVLLVRDADAAVAARVEALRSAG